MDTCVASLFVNAIRNDDDILQIEVDVRVAVEKVEQQHVIVQNALMKESLLELIHDIHVRSMENKLCHCVHRALSHDGKRECIAIILGVTEATKAYACLRVNVRDPVAVQERFNDFIAALHAGDVESVSSRLHMTTHSKNNVVCIVGIGAVLQEIIDNRVIVLVSGMSECIASFLRT